MKSTLIILSLILSISEFAQGQFNQNGKGYHSFSLPHGQHLPSYEIQLPPPSPISKLKLKPQRGNLENLSLPIKPNDFNRNTLGSQRNGSGDFRRLNDGGATSGGGDEDRLVDQLELRNRPILIDREELLKSFVHYARIGVKLLKAYSQFGWRFGNGEQLTSEDINTLYSIIDDLESGQKFFLDDKLVDPTTGKPRVAQNFSDGTFILNPTEWALLKEKYATDDAEAMRIAIAVHEVLQQPPLFKEGTGDFTFSSLLVKFKPLFIGPMDLQRATGMRVELRKGFAQQATCNLDTGFGDIQISEVRTKQHFGRDIKTKHLTWFETKNPNLCKPLNQGQPPPLIDLSYNFVFGAPSQVVVTLFALACSAEDEASCALIDFQSLPGEPLNINERVDHIISTDYRSAPAELRSLSPR